MKYKTKDFYVFQRNDDRLLILFRIQFVQNSTSFWYKYHRIGKCFVWLRKKYLKYLILFQWQLGIPVYCLYLAAYFFYFRIIYFIYSLSKTLEEILECLFY